jgi:hypothetical protein
MEFTVTKKIEAGLVSILVNGVPVSGNAGIHLLSRELTGTTEESGHSGVFTAGKITYRYGDHYRTFDQVSSYDKVNDSIGVIADVYKNRIQAVRDWVRSISDSHESVTVTVDSDGPAPKRRVIHKKVVRVVEDDE